MWSYRNTNHALQRRLGLCCWILKYTYCSVLLSNCPLPDPPANSAVLRLHIADMAPDPADKKQALDFANYFISYGNQWPAATARTLAGAPQPLVRRRLSLPPEGYAAGPRAHGWLPQRDPAEPGLL